MTCVPKWLRLHPRGPGEGPRLAAQDKPGFDAHHCRTNFPHEATQYYAAGDKLQAIADEALTVSMEKLDPLMNAWSADTLKLHASRRPA